MFCVVCIVRWLFVLLLFMVRKFGLRLRFVCCLVKYVSVLCVLFVGVGNVCLGVRW